MAQGEGFGLLNDQAILPDVPVAADAQPRLHVTLGAGIGVAPTYMGSDAYRLRAVPVLAARYGRFFFGAGGVGASLYRGSGWRVAALVAPGAGRKESADAHLAGLGDVDRTLRAGFVAAYGTGRMLARASALTDVGGEGQGTLVRADAFARWRAGERTAIFAGPGASWANRQYTQTFFGVNPEQSARSGLSEFQPGSGADSVRFSAGSVHRIDERWGIAGIVSGSRFVGDAAGSPIVQARSQYFLLVAAVYRVR